MNIIYYNFCFLSSQFAARLYDVCTLWRCSRGSHWSLGPCLPRRNWFGIQ